MKTPRNKFEKKTETQLKRARVSFAYEAEKVPYVLSGYYLPDFVFVTPTGKVYLECKGYFRPEHKRKMIAVKKQHPEIDLRILFYPFCSLKREQQYIKWAVKNGFRYAIGTIPKEWLRGL